MDGLGGLQQMHHHDISSLQSPSMQLSVQLPPVQTGQLSASNDPAMHALLDRLNQLENYKAHLENENKQMHQQLQVLSGFLNVVSNAVRTTENLLFSGVPGTEAPHVGLTAAEASQMGISTGPVPSASTVTAAGPVPASTPTPTGAMQPVPMLHPGSNGTGSSYTAAAGNGAPAAVQQQQPQQPQQQPQQQPSQQGPPPQQQQQQPQQQQQQAQQQVQQEQQTAPANAPHPAAAAAAAAQAAAGSAVAAGTTAGGSSNGYRRRSSATDLSALDGSRKRPRMEQQQPQQPAVVPPAPPAPVPAGPNPAALAAAAAAAGYMPQAQQVALQQAHMQQLIPLGIPMIGSGTSDITLRLTKVRGKTVLHGDDVMIYRVELARCGVFEKYLFLPNDAIPMYGVRSWQHRDAIPQELLKMVENCLTTKAVASEQYIEEIKAMKAYMLQQCPHLARWGLGSNKVRLVTESGMRDLVSRLHRTMQKHGTVILPKTLEVDVNWICCADAPQVPVHLWTAPVYSRRLQNLAEDTYAAAAAAAAAAAMPYGLPQLQHAGSSSGMLGPDSSPSQSGIAVTGSMVPTDLYQQQQLVPCGMPNMMPVMMANGQQQYEQQQYYGQQPHDMAAMQHHNMMQQQQQSMGLPPMQQQAMQQHNNNGMLVHSSYGTLGQHGSIAASSAALNGMHSQGSRGDLSGLVANGPAAADGGSLHGAALDPAAIAAMAGTHHMQQPVQQQQPQQPAVVAAPTPDTSVPGVQKQQQQAVSPTAAAAIQQRTRSPGGNGSSDSTGLQEAAAGLQALSAQNADLQQQQQQQPQQPPAGSPLVLDAPQQQQQDVPAKDGKLRDQQLLHQAQAGPDSSSGPMQPAGQQEPVDRQTSVPSPDATAAMCSAAATAITVQQ